VGLRVGPDLEFEIRKCRMTMSQNGLSDRFPTDDPTSEMTPQFLVLKWAIPQYQTYLRIHMFDLSGWDDVDARNRDIRLDELPFLARQPRLFVCITH
jgi:hypothetical protein